MYHPLRSRSVTYVSTYDIITSGRDPAKALPGETDTPRGVSPRSRPTGSYGTMAVNKHVQKTKDKSQFLDLFFEISTSWNLSPRITQWFQSSFLRVAIHLSISFRCKFVVNYFAPKLVIRFYYIYLLYFMKTIISFVSLLKCNALFLHTSIYNIIL